MHGCSNVVIPIFCTCISATPVFFSSLTTRNFLSNYDPSLPNSEDLGAIRDSKYLPGQAGGIVAAYLFVLLATGLGILLIRRRRVTQEAEKTQDTREIELQQAQELAVGHVYDSPISPFVDRFNHLHVPTVGSDQDRPYVWPTTHGWNLSKQISPVANDPNVDPRIAALHRNRDQFDLENIYGYVMEQQEAKAAGIQLTEIPTPHWRMKPQQPVPAAAPQRNPFSRSKTKPTSLELNDRPQSRASSIISSIMSPRRKGVRGMRISSPTPTSFQMSFPDGAEDEQPLTPRGPPPPIPTDQDPFVAHSRQQSTISYEITPTSPVRSIAENLASYSASRHQPNPSRPQTSILAETSEGRKGTPLLANPTGSPRPQSELKRAVSPPQITLRSPPKSTESTSPKLLPPPLKLSISESPLQTSSTSAEPSGNSASTTNSARPLLPTNDLNRPFPLRQFESSLAATGPTTPSQSNFSPASFATKTTILERINASTLSPGLKTPWTAGAVPYSPYQPFSPVMPVTPRLVGRKEMKAKQKEERKKGALPEIVSETEW